MRLTSGATAFRRGRGSPLGGTGRWAFTAGWLNFNLAAPSGAAGRLPAEFPSVE